MEKQNFVICTSLKETEAKASKLAMLEAVWNTDAPVVVIVKTNSISQANRVANFCDYLFTAVDCLTAPDEKKPAEMIDLITHVDVKMQAKIPAISAQDSCEEEVKK